MSFPLGKPLLVMLLLGIIGGIALWADRPKAPADKQVWVFADSHARILRGDSGGQRSTSNVQRSTFNEGIGAGSLVERWERATGRSVEVDLILSRALDVRLLSLFMSGTNSKELPDVVEIEINSVGKYFRPPVNEVGFYPLNDWLKELSPEQTILPSRLAPWTKEGVIFGIPHDVHPTGIVYRKDLFESAGVDLASAKTWVEFQSLCLRAQERWAAGGHRERRALELKKAGPDQLLMMLMQRHVNLLDDRNRVHMAEPVVAQTLAFYAQLVAGPRAIGGETPSSGALWTRTMASGQVCAAICADWRIADLKNFAPELAGKVALMPMPRFEAGDAPTATWGGTMVGIPRHCRDPRAAWEMVKFFYLSPEGLAARRRYTDILPPVVSAWEDPAYHRPDEFFGGQRIGAVYVELARQLPVRYVTPFTIIASQQLGAAVSRAVAYEREDGEAGLEGACQGWLDDAAGELEKRVEFGKFGE